MSHPIYADPNAIYKLLNEIEQLRERNAELLAACKAAVAEFDTGWFAQGKSIIVAAIENTEEER